jgi:5-methylcytosine-specific restriction endonuclease McrA
MPYNDPEKQRESNTRWRATCREFFVDYMGRVCNHCGDTDGPFDFDHINPADKKYSINTIITRKKEFVFEELAKCQLLCKKCHKDKTAKDRRAHITEHGIYSMYKIGCRCQPCKDANAARKRTQRAKNKN